MASGPCENEAILVISEGDLEGMTHALSAEETLIGRNPGCQIRLQDESISREHAFVSFDESDGSWVIEDLQSTNGTKLNGKRVRSATLSHGDRVQVGQTQFEFRLKGRP